MPFGGRFNTSPAYVSSHITRSDRSRRGQIETGFRPGDMTLRQQVRVLGLRKLRVSEAWRG